MGAVACTLPLSFVALTVAVFTRVPIPGGILTLAPGDDLHVSGLPSVDVSREITTIRLVSVFGEHQHSLEVSPLLFNWTCFPLLVKFHMT